MRHRLGISSFLILIHLVFAGHPGLAQTASLVAPRSVKADETFEVRVSGPNERGDMVRIGDAGGKVFGRSYAHVGNARNGVVHLTAPAQPGEYTVLYVSSKVVIAESPLTVEPVSATVTAPASAGANGAVEVTFQGPEFKGDYLQFVDASGSPVRGAYQYVGNARDGKISLKAPVEAGKYTIAYFTGASRTNIGSTEIVVKSAAATVTAPASIGANDHIEVTFAGPDNQGDYLQFVDAAGKPVRGNYQYTGNAKDAKLSLRAPVEPGDYTIAYFTGSTIIGSTPVTVRGVQAVLRADREIPAGAHFEVKWEGPDNAGDRVDLLTPDGARSSSYAHVGNHPDGALPLRAPEQAGAYRIVYLTGGKVIGETSIDVVDVTAAIDAPDEAEGNTRFPVAWQGPGNHGDNIELVVPGTDKNLAYQYVDPERGHTVMLMAPANPGTFELRYVTHGRRVLATRSIKVTPPRREPGSLSVTASATPVLGPNDALEIVLDASGSMLQRQNGERRIEIAKRTIKGLLDETIPEGTPFALRVFGHKEADKCRTDLEIPLAPLSRQQAREKVAGINAMNLAKTPIADSLAMTGSDLRNVDGERVIILITDGEETCEGDPAEAIARLRADNIDVRVNIVGYAIDDTGLRETFARWADLGGGAYFNAAGETDLAEALTNSVNPSFVVLDEAGNEVAQGIAGGDRVVLSPGSYEVRAGDRTHAVDIEAGRHATLTLR